MIQRHLFKDQGENKRSCDCKPASAEERRACAVPRKAIKEGRPVPVLTFVRAQLTIWFCCDCCGLLSIARGSAVGFMLTRPQRIQSLAEPGVFRPSPVLIRVVIELRRFHNDLRKVQQAACQRTLLYFTTNFFGSLSRTDENGYLLAIFERHRKTIRKESEWSH